MKILLISLSLFVGCKIKQVEKINYPDCSSSDIEMMDSCLLGRPLGYAIEKLHLDTSKFITFDEPPGILRGISIYGIDSCEIEIYTKRKSVFNSMSKMNFRLYYTLILDSSIIGISWTKRYSNKKRSIGNGISY